MMRLKWAQWLILLFILINLILLLALPAMIGIKIVFAAAVIILGYLVVRLEKLKIEKEAKCQLQQQQQESHLYMLQTINHLRHDWMNDIQLLFGYIQLKKYEHLHTYVDKLRIKMQHESLLSKLGHPSLITYLLSFRVNSTVMQLEVEMEQEIHLRSLFSDADRVAALIKETIEKFKHCASSAAEEANVLNLQLESEEGSLFLDFVYRGQYDRDQLQTYIDKKLLMKSVEFELVQHNLQEDEAGIAIRLPYRN